MSARTKKDIAIPTRGGVAMAKKRKNTSPISGVRTTSKATKRGRPAGSATPFALLPSYKPAIVNETAAHGVHVLYAVLDISTGKYKRYRIMLNKQAKYYPGKRRFWEFAQSVATQLNVKLAGGWTPLGENNNSRFYTPIVDVMTKYLDDRRKEVRHATYLSYNSTCNILTEWGTRTSKVAAR